MNESDRKYDRNLIYNSLVRDKKDILGLVAYGIYKKAKVEHISDFIKENDSPPTDDDLIPFQQTCRKHIDLYNSQAVELTNEFCQEYLSNYINELDDAYEQKYKKRIGNLRPLSWGNILSSFLGSVAFAVTVALAILYLIYYQFGLSNAVEFIARNVNRPASVEMLDSNSNPHNNFNETKTQ